MPPADRADDQSLYTLEYRRDDGEWRPLQGFRRPLDADRAYQSMLEAGAKRPLRLALPVLTSFRFYRNLTPLHASASSLSGAARPKTVLESNVRPNHTTRKERRNTAFGA